MENQNRSEKEKKGSKLQAHRIRVGGRVPALRKQKHKRTLNNGRAGGGKPDLPPDDLGKEMNRQTPKLKMMINRFRG